MRSTPIGGRAANPAFQASALSLGTMTFGEQNTESESHDLIDLAFDHGINMLDVAEMYPVAPRAETQGRSEEIVGSWVKARGNRDQVIIATKVAGRGNMPWIRGENRVMDAKNIAQAVDGSLKRLQTDYIDLYYLHWPDRPTNMFGRLGYTHDPDAPEPNLAETLGALAEHVKAGKIRHIGLSNETPWGVHQFLMMAEKDPSLPRIAAIQNPYSLLNRTFEVGLSEMAIREDVPLMAYAPLAGGALTGKYANGSLPPRSRWVLWPNRFTRYTKPAAQMATERYLNIARRHGLDPTQMALAYVLNQPFVGSAIIGATTTDQMKTSLAAKEMTLSEAVLAEIEETQTAIPNPAP